MVDDNKNNREYEIDEFGDEIVIAADDDVLEDTELVIEDDYVLEDDDKAENDDIFDNLPLRERIGRVIGDDIIDIKRNGINTFIFNKDTLNIEGFDTRVETMQDVLVIPDRIDRLNVRGVAANAFKDKGIRRITLPRGISYLGKNAFADNPIDEISIETNYIEIIEPYPFGEKCIQGELHLNFPFDFTVNNWNEVFIADRIRLTSVYKL